MHYCVTERCTSALYVTHNQRLKENENENDFCLKGGNLDYF